MRCAHVSLRRNFANGSFSRILRTNRLALHPLATISSAFPKKMVLKTKWF